MDNLSMASTAHAPHLDLGLNLENQRQQSSSALQCTRAFMCDAANHESRLRGQYRPVGMSQFIQGHCSWARFHSPKKFWAWVLEQFPPGPYSPAWTSEQDTVQALGPATSLYRSTAA